MTLEEALRELGKAIQADERFVAIQEASAVNDKDTDLQEKMHQLQLISMNYQQESQKGEEMSQEKLEGYQNDYQKLYEEIMQLPNMIAYSEAAHQMEHMSHYISAMLGKFFDGADPETCEVSQDECGGGCDCGSCGGCH